MVNRAVVEARIGELVPLPEGEAESLAENLQVLRAQVRELSVRFDLHDPELLAMVLKVTPEEARALLEGQAL